MKLVENTVKSEIFVSKITLEKFDFDVYLLYNVVKRCGV
jgi:hypothetical protein